MAADQRNARIFGVLFLITFATSIGALALFQSVLDDPAGYIAGGGKDNQIYLGAFLELLLIIANVGTAVVLYPIVRRQNELPRSATSLLESSSASSLRPGSFSCSGSSACARTSDAADLAVSLAALKDWTPVRPRADRPFGNGLTSAT